MVGTNSNQRIPVSLYVVMYCGAAALLFFSLHYYKLRAGFSDTPGYIINMTRNGGLEIAHYRYVGALSQWLAAILVKAGASLRAIAVAYSFGYTFAPVAMMLLAIHWLRQPAAALAILLQFTLLNMLLFYYPVSELQMGLGLLLLYNGVTDYYESKPGGVRPGFIIATLLLVPTIIFAHPMAVPAVACWLAYRLLCGAQRRAIAIIMFAAVAVAYAVKKAFFIPSYEAVKGITWETIRPFGLNYYGGPLAQSIYKYLISDGFLVLVLLAGMIAGLTITRRWRLLIFTIGSVLLLFTVVEIAFEDFSGMHFYDHYYEHYLQPAVLFILLAFCRFFVGLRMDGRMKAALVAVILIISLAKINSGAKPFERRQKWEYSYLSLMDSLRLKKAIVGRVWVPDGIWRGSFWSATSETLFLSALEGPQHAKTLFMAWNIDELNAPYDKGDEILMDGWSHKQSELPRRYFQLNDKPYVFLEHTVPDSVLERLRWP